MNDFRTLAELLAAGQVPAEAVNHLSGDKRQHTTWQRCARDLRQGRSMSQTLQGHGLAIRYEALVIAAAEQAGRLPDGLRWLAQRVEARAQRAKRLSGRMLLPLLVTGVAALAMLVLRSFQGAPIAGALFSAIALLAAVGGIHVLAVKLVRMEPARLLGPMWSAGLLQGMAMGRAAFEQQFYTVLGWQLASGLDALAALSQLRGLYPATDYDQRLAQARQEVSGGRALAEALIDAGLVFNPALAQTLRNGEAAGRLSSSLEHYLRLAGEDLDARLEAWLTWLPRIYYLALAVTLFAWLRGN